jgi:hypothetical protein
MKRRPARPSNIPSARPPKRAAVPLPPSHKRPRLAVRRADTRLPPRAVHKPPPKREIARIIDDGDRSLVDVLDSLLNQGVVLNADLVLALADVDLVYVRLSALLVAADRVLPPKTA